MQMQMGLSVLPQKIYLCEIVLKKFSRVSSWFRDAKLSWRSFRSADVKLYFLRASSLNILEREGQMVIAGRGSSLILLVFLKGKKKDWWAQ
jgi:hypothetical protein